MYNVQLAMSNIVYDIDRMSLSDRVYHYVKDLILSGELKGGERIPEEVVASRFGLSRTPVREAMRRLEEYGLIKIKPRTYAEVVSLLPDEAPEVAKLRSAIEVLAVGLLVERGSEEDFDELESIADRCREALRKGEIARTFELDSEFHLGVALRSRNSHLFELFEKLDAKVQLLRLVLKLPREHLTKFVAQHQLILNALRKRDRLSAQKLMESHILDQLDLYLQEPIEGRAGKDPD